VIDEIVIEDPSLVVLIGAGAIGWAITRGIRSTAAIASWTAA